MRGEEGSTGLWHGGSCGTGPTGPDRAGLTLALIVVRVEIDGKIVGDLQGKRGGGSQCPPTRHHSPRYLLSPTGATAKGCPEGRACPWGPTGPRHHGHPLTSYLGGILAPKPRAENFLSLQGKRCEEPQPRQCQHQCGHHRGVLALGDPPEQPTCRSPGRSRPLRPAP